MTMNAIRIQMAGGHLLTPADLLTAYARLRDPAPLGRSDGAELELAQRGLWLTEDAQGPVLAALATGEVLCAVEATPALQNAHLVLQEARRQGRTPDQIVPSATGGISFYWFGTEVLQGGAHRRYVWVECDDKIGALTKDRVTGVESNVDLTLEALPDGLCAALGFL